jgi:tight adherence protein B
VTPLLGALVGPLVVLGVISLVFAARPPQRAKRSNVWGGLAAAVPAAWSDRALVRAVLGIVALVVTYVATGWPVGALLAGLAGAAAPSLVGGKRRREAAVARVEAIASWIEQLRGVMSAAGGIKEAIVATGPLVPGPIAPEVRMLVHRLSVRRERLRPALVAFADDLDHPLGDMVVASLLLAAEDRGSPVEMLGEVANSAREVATMRRDVEAQRASTYVTTRLILFITVGMTAWLVIGQRRYMEPYSTPQGQLMLLLVGVLFTLAAWWMNQMAQPTEPPRLLKGLGERVAER